METTATIQSEIFPHLNGKLVKSMDALEAEAAEAEAAWAELDTEEEDWSEVFGW